MSTSKTLLDKMMGQVARATKATKETTKMSAKAKRRNGAKTARAWCITTTMPVMH